MDALLDLINDQYLWTSSKLKIPPVFHALQEAARILCESIDASRKGQVALRDRKAAAK